MPCGCVSDKEWREREREIRFLAHCLFLEFALIVCVCVCARISVMILSNALSLSLSLPPLYLKKNTTETALGNLFLLKLTNVCSVSLMLKQMIRNEFILTSCVCVCAN